eukprot:TRINITY_DN12102_c0_g1_i10.p3 TRINITY_DN12102_c0_g1~~TRINITY_DN12102_c0_g1_i10.p3  ORF type:complete len:224 (+),score=26.45 TRINITY_DN12102_c0_g1_i10:2734-3405(+)
MHNILELIASIGGDEAAKRYRSVMAPPSGHIVRRSSLVRLARQSSEQRTRAWSSRESDAPALIDIAANHTQSPAPLNSAVRRESGYVSQRLSLDKASLAIEHHRHIQQRHASSQQPSVAEIPSTVNLLASRSAPASTDCTRNVSPDGEIRPRSHSPNSHRGQATPEPKSSDDDDIDSSLDARLPKARRNTPTRRSLDDVLAGLSAADVVELQQVVQTTVGNMS